MDDLTQQLQQILSDPQQMQQLQAMAGALGLGGGAPEQPQPAPPPPSPPAAAGGFGGLDGSTLQLVSRMAPLMGQLHQEDDATRLLHALRPLLSPARREKLDQAVRLLQMLRLLPLLRGGGLF